MKTKLLRKVRRKVSLCERNGLYYIFKNGDLLYSEITFRNILVAKALYMATVIVLAQELSNFKCKKRIL